MPFPVSNPSLRRALDSQGYADPTPVQAAVLGVADDRDLLVSAQTGSGKTVAFGLAAAQTLLGDRERFGEAGPPLALIIAPTRELALQVQRELAWLYAETGARVVACVGGMDPRREAREMAAGCHVVVGTPGRLRDHLERGNLDVSALSVVVLDEADEMLDLGFREDLEFILDAAPAERRSLLFSATIAREIAALARKFQKNAERIDTTVRSEPHGDIEYRAIRVAPSDMDQAIVNLLRWFEAPGALVFCSTREAVRRLHASLVERGFAAVALSGELSQSERTHALQALRDGRARVCVATDVAARGLDLPELGLVIHYDLPLTREALTHRSGRTGRAGRKGVSVVMVPFTRRRKAEQLLASANIEATWAAPPTADEIRLRDQERLLADPVFAEEPVDGDAALVARLLSERSAEEVAAALIRMYRARLPAAEELFEETPAHLAREERERPAGRGGGDGAAWFRLTIGRRDNADPKWLIPLICRLGHVTKKEIGSIRIFDKETRFEIEAATAERFAATVKDVTEKNARIEPSIAPEAGERPTRPKHIPAAARRGPPRERREDSGPPAAVRPPADKPVWVRGEEPSAPRSYGDKPARPRERDSAPAPRPAADKPAWVRGEAPAKTARPADDKPAWVRSDKLAGPKGAKPAKPGKTFGDKAARFAKADGAAPRPFGGKGGEDRPKRKPKG